MKYVLFYQDKIGRWTYSDGSHNKATLLTRANELAANKDIMNVFVMNIVATNVPPTTNPYPNLKLLE